MGNFKCLIDFRMESGDAILKQHVKTSVKKAKYTSKTAQNDWLSCIKLFLQYSIVRELKDQSIGPYYGFQCDEVSDSRERTGITIYKGGKTSGTPC